MEVGSVISDSRVYTPEEHFPKLSSCLAPLGTGGGIMKICFCAGNAVGQGWDRKALMGSLKRITLNIKWWGGGRRGEGDGKESEREKNF